MVSPEARYGPALSQLSSFLHLTAGLAETVALGIFPLCVSLRPSVCLSVSSVVERGKVPVTLTSWNLPHE